MSNQALRNQLALAARAIDNGLHNSEVAERLSRFGYTAEKLQEGWALYEQAQQLYQEQEDRYGDQFGATDAFRKAWEEAKELYGKHLTIARMLFKGNRDIEQDLALEGKRPQAFNPWLEVAVQFYDNALAQTAILERFAELGLTAEMLQEGKAKVEAVAAAEHAQEVARGKAQEATRRRDEAFAALGAWMEDYLTVAKVALKDAPQLAEMLGILVRS